MVLVWVLIDERRKNLETVVPGKKVGAEKIEEILMKKNETTKFWREMGLLRIGRLVHLVFNIFQCCRLAVFAEKHWFEGRIRSIQLR